MNRIKIEPIPRLDAHTPEFVLNFNMNTDLNYSHYRIKTGDYGNDVKLFSFIINCIYI